MHLDYLHIENFKGIPDFTIVLNGKDLNTYGFNFKGKTTLTKDAISYLLFDKDSKGQPATGKGSFGILPIVNGVVQEHLEVVVEAHYKNPDIKLKKKYVPLRDKNKKITGHTTEYYVDDEYKKLKKDYDAVVSQIASPERFRLLTDPLYFNRLPDDVRRRYILEFAGVDPVELAKRDQRQVTLQKEKTDLKKQLDDIKSKCEGAYSTLPEPVELTENIEELRKRQQELQNQKAAIQAGGTAAQVNAELQKIDSELQQCKSQLIQRYTEHKVKIWNEQEKLSNDLSIIRRTIENNNNLINDRTSKIKDNENQRAKLRAERKELRSQSFNGGICPLLNVSCSDLSENQKAAEGAFNTRKADRLTVIDREGPELKALADQWQNDINELQAANETDKDKVKEIEDKQKKNKEQLTNLDTVLNNIESLDEYKEIEAKKKPWEEQLSKEQPDTKDIDSELESIATRINTTNQQQAAINSRNESLSKIETLETKEKEILVKYEKAKKDYDAIKAQSQKQSLELQDKINGMFKFCNYRMFRELQKKDIDGNPETENCCECFSKSGVPHSNFSGAEEVHAGIDAIRIMQNHWKISPPVIIDERWNIIELPDTTGMQIISLYPIKGCDLEVELVENQADSYDMAVRKRG